MTDELDEAARRRAEAVRARRHGQADPDGRVGPVWDWTEPPNGFELPEPDSGVDLELPSGLRAEAETTRKKLEYGFVEEFGTDLDAETHYWPLVVHLGVDRLKEMWLEEVKRLLETADDLESPD